MFVVVKKKGLAKITRGRKRIPKQVKMSNILSERSPLILNRDARENTAAGKQAAGSRKRGGT